MIDGKEIQYAREMLALNPAYDVDRVLECRDHFFGVTAYSQSTLLDSFQQRRVAEQKLEQIREAFWDTTPETLVQHLNAMPIDELPDLAVVVNRLKHVANLRDLFSQLERHHQSQPLLLNALRRIVVLPPRQAGAFREQMLRSVRASDNLQQYKKMIRLIQAEFLPIYQLESDWLDNVARQKKRSSASAGGMDFSDVRIPGWVIVAAIFFLIRLLGLLFK